MPGKKETGNPCADRNPVPAEQNEGMGLDIAQQPPHCNERNERGDYKPEQHQIPLLRRGSNGRMTDDLVYLEPPLRQASWECQREKKTPLRPGG